MASEVEIYMYKYSPKKQFFLASFCDPKHERHAYVIPNRYVSISLTSYSSSGSRYRYDRLHSYIRNPKRTDCTLLCGNVDIYSGHCNSSTRWEALHDISWSRESTSRALDFDRFKQQAPTSCCTCKCLDNRYRSGRCARIFRVSLSFWPSSRLTGNMTSRSLVVSN